MHVGIGLNLSNCCGGGGTGQLRPSLFAPDMPVIRTGDSISARADNTDWPLWGNFLAWGRFSMPSYGYQAISGSEENEPPGANPRTNPADILRADRMSYYLAGARSGVACMAAIGINSNGGSGNTLAQMQDGDNELAAAIKATGAARIISTITPSGTTADPTPLNDWRKSGLADVDLVIDPAAQWIAATGGYSGNTDSAAGDLLHPNVIGAIRAGYSLPVALEAAGYELGATYGASGASPADNLCTCWALTGTGGTKAGAGSANISGSVPTGVTSTLVNAGVNQAISVSTQTVPVLVAAPGGGWTAQLFTQAVLILDLTGTAVATATNSVLFTAPISPGEVAGSMYEGLLYAKLTLTDGVSAPAANINIGLQSNSASLFKWSDASTKVNAGFITVPVEGVARGWTRAAVQATGSNGLLFQYRLSAGDVDARIVLGMPYFRKVERTAFATARAVHTGRDDLGGPTVGPSVGNATASWTTVVGTPTAALRPGEAWSGDGLTFTYQWQKSPDKVTWTDIDSAVSTPPTYAPMTGDGYLRGKVIGANSFGSDTAYTVASTNAV